MFWFARGWLPLLVAPLLLAACAAGGGSRETAVEPLTVAVRNDLRPPTAVTIRLVSDGGARYLLGNVPPQQTRSLQVELGVVTGEYHLVAQAADGRELQSRTFAAFPYDRLEWSLFSNSLNLQSP